jgi:hypothetical protein
MKRRPLSCGAIAAVLRTKFSPMPELGRSVIAKSGPIAALLSMQAIWQISGKIAGF